MFFQAVVLASMALAAPLHLDTRAPPSVVADLPELGPGGVRLRFEGLRPVEVDAWPAAVVVLASDAPVPDDLAAVGEPLGRSLRSWRVPAGPGETGLDVALRWQGMPGVAEALPDLALPRRSTMFDDPRYPSQWYLELLEMEALYAETLGDPDVRVAVIDSGTEIDHPDLAAGIVAPYDAFADTDDPSPKPGEFCFDGGDAICDVHGTAVSGIVGARANNGEGIVGLCPGCSVIPIKLLGQGAPALSADIAAFEHAIDAGAAVINNSWGYIDPVPVPAPLAAVIERAATEGRDGLGTLVVFAAGNDDREIRDNELQALPSVLCVSASDRYGLPTAYTNSGRAVDLAAPSATVTTSVNGGYTETFGGTSAAAPVVSGLAGWALSYRPDLTADALRAALVATARPSPLVSHGDDGHHPVYGYGELDALALLAVLDGSAEDAEGPGDDLEGERGGCGCATGSGSGAGWVLALALVAARRRPQRRGWGRRTPRAG